MSFYARIVFAGLCSLALLVSNSLAQERVRFATHYRLSPKNVLPVTASMEKLYWQEQGLTIEWIGLDGGPATARAIAAGAVDMGTNNIADMVRGIAAGLPTIMVADAGYHSDYSLWVLADSSLRKPQDLKGVKIASLAAGGMAHTYTLAMLKALGLEGQVKIVNVGGGAQMVAAVKAGVADSTMQALTTMAPLLVKGEFREFLKTSDYVPLVDLVHLFAHKDFSERKPEVVKKAIKAFFKGAVFVMNNREWTLSKMEKDFKFSPEAAMVIWEVTGYSKTGRIDENKIKTVVKFLVDYGLLAPEKVPPLERIFTANFIP